MIIDLFNPKTSFLEKAAGLFITVSSIAGFFHFTELYYVFLSLIGVKMIVQSSGTITIHSTSIIFFLFACLCSLIINTPPPVFNAWRRLGVFSLMLLVVCPILENEQMCAIRQRLFKYVLGTCVLLSLGSFFAYFLGINMFVRGGELQDISAGRFSGLMSHSMFLGPVAAISTIYLVYCFFETTVKWQKFSYIIIAGCCFSASLLSASRIAVVSCVSGLVFFIFRYYRRSMAKAIAIILFIIGIAIAFFPLWGGLADFLVEKQLGNIEMGGMMYSRESKIQARIEEFKSSPIIGIGFNTVNPSLDVVNNINGQIEPGSSWLEIPSMTGLIGFILFLLIVGHVFFRAWRVPNSLSAGLLVGLLVFFFTHMLAEGWVLSARAFLSFLFWLTVGVTYAFDSSHDYLSPSISFR